jgi:hypothetical protein
MNNSNSELAMDNLQLTIETLPTFGLPDFLTSKSSYLPNFNHASCGIRIKKDLKLTSNWHVR